MEMGQTRTSYYRSEYVGGNTVRKMNGNAVRKPAPQRERRVYVNGKRVEQNERQLKAKEHALMMNAPYVAFLAIVSIVCLVMCVTYLRLQSDISATRTNIASLKTQISTVQSQNDALNYSINSYVDVDHIYDIATTKLGMKQARGNQISRYKSSESGYTVQYGDIPSK